ncbi:3'-5' exonuclease [Corynebacterium sp. 320]|uniref:3'-5' exonuclease n=1 Tax=Corynebacterium zhongnanshanii TaxID=2768834 RepID=A0ABQ6VHH0_9CORY|nr:MULTISPECIES: 3'-5' exonuclease [Corynebacterium]KAB1503917.1 3'-5' exonuclease [Corynebacterium sp. 320]KAB1552984.1 3'-5' exonuclease [Corynebacterium sp. 321]KAB1553796.1 3'-5' exonuclease [Corynebacterium sp. 319]KAB3523233.1 3'-5' exonuclease [Corynebacterium zhongnanshanii]KAB3528053.1 3'-5' exonuclease [Corynebacterium sp. 250]
MNGFDPSHMLSFDLETTGVDPTTARIVTSALVTIRGRERQDLEMLADPGIEIPKAASDVHGITTDYAREHGRDHEEVLKETINRIREGWSQGATLIVYNAPYDLSVLKSLDPSFTIDGLVVDPLVIDKKMDQYRKGKKTLESVSEHYGVPVENAHEATSDAIAAARVAWKLSRAYPEIVSMTGDELMHAQATWHYEAQTDLQEYFTRIGKEADVKTSWPLIV